MIVLALAWSEAHRFAASHIVRRRFTLTKQEEEMRRIIRSTLAVALVVGMSPQAAYADGGEFANCMWMADGCGCSPFGSCAGVNCDDNSTGYCKKNAEA